MKKAILKNITCAALIAGIGVTSMACGKTPDYDFSVNYDGIKKATTIKDVAVHDPSIVEDDGTYYIFGSHMSAAQSSDLKNWTNLGNGYSTHNKVYTDIKNYDGGQFDFAGSKVSLNPTDDGQFHVWAPDVIYNKAMGCYVMYYCASSTWNTSAIIMGTSDNIDGPYEYKKTVVYSGITKDNLSATDILDYVDEDVAIERYTKKAGYEYNYNEFPNAIDPTIFYDADGKMWMVYGSWSGGIFLLQIDETTGDVIHPEDDKSANVDRYYGKRLIGGKHNSIEGPYIIYDADVDYYYLLVSYGELTREGGYQIRVFRSKTVDGEYVDMNGAYPGIGDAHGYYGLKLSGNYYLPSLEQAYMATGHCSALIDADGKKYICYHTRFDNGTEQHTPRVKQYFLNEEGWPCMLPYATSGETISQEGYEQSEVIGRYFLINQGTDISKKIAEPVIVYLNKDKSIVGDGISGSYEMSADGPYVHMSIDGKEYSGVFCKQLDEAGTEVMTFAAVGENESIAAVSYR